VFSGRPAGDFQAWIENLDDQDWPAFYRKLGEAYQIPPWRIPKELSVPQMFALFVEPEAPNMAALVAQANVIRAQKGLKPYTLVRSQNG
jgi:hypothetical protein